MEEVVINIDVTEESVSVNPTEVIENVQVVTSESETSTINIITSEEVASVQVTEIEEKVEVLVDSELFKKHEEDFDHDNIPSDQMIQSWNSKAEGDHTHEGVYSPYNHNHDASYSPKVHSHSEYSSVFHNHDGSYSGINHNHSGEYASTSHDHNGVYEPKKGTDDNYVTSAEKSAIHSHTNKQALDLVSGVNTGDQDLSGLEPKKGVNDLYVTSAEKEAWNGKAEGNHTHDMSGYAAVSHNHDSVYSGISHTHDMSSFATTAYVNGLVGDIETILASI